MNKKIKFSAALATGVFIGNFAIWSIAKSPLYGLGVGGLAAVISFAAYYFLIE